MNWKDSDIRKFAMWFLTFFEEDNGKASTKRIICWILAIVCAKAGLQVIYNVPVEKWSDSIYFLITIFGMIASLLAVAYIPSRNPSEKQQ